uniref:O-acyltransferase WSD1 C-terminal domain-containing protein n=1 Tax=Aegilops tauschii subsp. strangulata TaxID=200361 RepID=A0A453DPN8_AEGTS
TLVDVTMIVATILFLSDPRTLFTRADGVEPRTRKRFVHRTLSFDDVKLVKTAMNCTINDVLAGVTAAALSQYYFKNSGDTNTKRICLRSLVLVDARPVSTRQTYVTRVETGNRLSSLICPFNIALQDDPLEYVREAKRFMHRKKSSLEVLFTRVVGEFLVKNFGVKVYFLLLLYFICSSQYNIAQTWTKHYVYCIHLSDYCNDPLMEEGRSFYLPPFCRTNNHHIFKCPWTS